MFKDVLLVTSLFYVSLGAVIRDQSVSFEVPRNVSSTDTHVLGSKGVSGLLYGPSIGVSDKKPNYLYWSDAEYLSTYYQSKDFRILSTIICTRKSHGGRLVGLQAAYRLAYEPASQWIEHFAPYHGWSNWNSYRMVSKYIHLDTEHGESISKITYRICGRHWEGIKIETTKHQSVECGDWDYTRDAVDESCDRRNGGILVPHPKRKVVGLYGEAKGTRASVEQGIRGLGLLTIPA